VVQAQVQNAAKIGAKLGKSYKKENLQNEWLIYGLHQWRKF